jgi:alanine-synthesizing transaminase
VLRVPRTRTDEEWALQLLREESVLVQPGYFFDFDVDGHLVISLLTAPAVFREGVERLLESVNA